MALISGDLQINKYPTNDLNHLNARNAFGNVAEMLRLEARSASVYSDVRELLKMVGFSQNSRDRILRLSANEMDYIRDQSPPDEALWPSYIKEVQTLLMKMDEERRREMRLHRSPSMGRPIVTAELAQTIIKLTQLRFLISQGMVNLDMSRMRELLSRHGMTVLLADLAKTKRTLTDWQEESISIQSAIKLLEVYRDELIKPPLIKSRRNFDEFDWHIIEMSDFSWTDDNGETYLRAIREKSLITLYDDLPLYESVIDWFLDAKPAMDNNQNKRSWAYYEEASRKWHDGGYLKKFILEYPDWECLAEEHREDLHAVLPPDSPYTVVPLTTPEQLLDESNVMHHCVSSYIESCIDGDVRVFSIRERMNAQRLATAELSVVSGRWVLVQLKGKWNQELMWRSQDSRDPLSILLEKLVDWYNEKTTRSLQNNTAVLQQAASRNV